LLVSLLVSAPCRALNAAQGKASQESAWGGDSTAAEPSLCGSRRISGHHILDT